MRRELIVCLLLLSITLAIYWQVGNHAFLNYDDNVYVTNNPHVLGGLTGSGVIWAFTQTEKDNWFPLTWLSHMLDWQLFGAHPMGHHLVNLLLHAANTLLLFAALRRMTGAVWRPALVSALFALHPLHVESVAWVAERKDVLSTFFGFLTLLFYAGYAERPSRSRYVVTILAFALGLMAKPMLVTLPFLLLLLDYWPLDRLALSSGDDSASKNSRKKMRPSGRLPILQSVWEKAPFFALAAIVSLVTFIFQRKAGAVATTEAFPVGSRMANALVSYLHYIRQTVWPSDLSVLYPHPGTSLPMWQAAAAGFVVLGLSVLTVALRERRYVAVGWFWYVGTLVPVIGLVQVGIQARADRYTYMPLIGLFIMIAWGIPDLVKTWAHAQTFLAILATTILAALTACTWTQLSYWTDSISLFTHALKVTTGNYTAHHDLANALADRGSSEEAILHYTEALRIKPDYADAYDNWGTVLVGQGKFAEAVDRFRMALKLKPDFAEAHSNLGLAFHRQGQLQEAIAQYREAVRLNPQYAQAHNNLAAALAETGHPDEAIAHYTEAVHLRPEYFNARNNLGSLLAQLGRLDEAAAQFREALRLKPDSVEARDNLAAVLSKIDKAR